MFIRKSSTQHYTQHYTLRIWLRWKDEKWEVEKLLMKIPNILGPWAPIMGRASQVGWGRAVDGGRFTPPLLWRALCPPLLRRSSQSSRGALEEILGLASRNLTWFSKIRVFTLMALNLRQKQTGNFSFLWILILSSNLNIDNCFFSQFSYI